MAAVVHLEPDLDHQQIVSLCLSPAHDVRSVADGEQAWRLLQAGRFELIIAETLAPGMSGLDLLRHCRLHPRLRSIPFIFLTGRAMPQEVTQAMVLRPDRYVTKPFGTHALRVLVDQMLAAVPAVSTVSRAGRGSAPGSG